MPHLTQHGLTVSHTSEPPVLTLEHVLNAPRELVFKAWTEPERLARWFGPRGWSLPVCTIDLRPGGVWHYCMRGPAGEESWGRAVYAEIVPPERLVYTDAFSDAQGSDNANMPHSHVSIELADLGAKTRLINRTQFASVADLQKTLDMGVVEGMGQTFERLVAFLAEN